MSDNDLIRRGDAIAACAVGPSDEWARATKSGYTQAATDCTFNVLRIPAVQVTVKQGEIERAVWSAMIAGEIRDITEDDMANIIAHLSYECEPRGKLPNANSLMMEVVRLRNALAASIPTDPVANAGCLQPMRVKPLEWHKSIIEAWNEDWHTVTTGYTVRCADENGWKWSTSGAFGYEYSPEAAKAAAQADYDARILSALEWKTTVSPEVQALVKAVQESQVQIAYLHERIGESTGSGNAVMARNTAALAAWKESTK